MTFGDPLKIWFHGSGLVPAMLLISLLSIARCRAQALPIQLQPVEESSIRSVSMLSHSGLYYEECGSSSEAIVLLHDGVVDSSVWNGVWKRFCKQFHTIRYDRRGYGRSAPALKPYDETVDLLDLLTERNIAYASLVGASHGSEVAVDFALRYPQRLKALVLVGPVLSGMGFSDIFSARAEKTFGGAQKDSIAERILRVVNDPYLTAQGSALARLELGRLLSASPQDLTHSDHRIPTPSAVGRLSAIRIPTLILTGALDIPDVHAHSGALEVGIRNAQRVILPDSGHLLYLEHPDEFTRVVLDFLYKSNLSVANTPSQDDPCIQDLHTKDVAATLSGDPIQLAELFTEDGVLFEPGLPPQRGRAAILAEDMREKHDNPYSREISYKVDIVDAHIDGERGVEWGTFDASFQEKPGSHAITIRGSIIRTLERQSDGTWRFSLVMWTPIR